MRIKLSEIHPNPANPRFIRDDPFRSLKRSIAQFPAMLQKRPIAVIKDGKRWTAIGGNQRTRALADLKGDVHNDNFIAVYETTTDAQNMLIEYFATGVPVVDCTDLSPDEQRRFIIADNLPFGEWDTDALANEWGTDELKEWGLELPGMEGLDVSPDDHGTDFSLPEGDKEPFQQMTFTFADEQAALVKNAIEEMKKTDEFKYAETMGNENSNGNALYLIAAAWVGQRI